MWRDCQRDARSRAHAASSHPHLPAAPQLPGLRDYSSGPCAERPIAKSLASSGLLAYVVLAKYFDHLPLYRQSQIFARHGVETARLGWAARVGV
jgi:transposase